MKKIRYILLLALCAISMSACQDDLVENASTGGADVNKPVKVDLKFGIPKSMEVEVSRADNSYSGMYGVRLYVFSGNNLLGEPQQVLEEDNTLIKGNDAGTSSQGQYYTANNITLYEGIQTVYAVGNITRTGYWSSNTLSELDQAAREGKNKLEEYLYSLSSETVIGKTFPSFTTEYMPLSGVSEITVENGQTDDIISLKRLVAQIKFKIDTEYSGNGAIVTFTPSSYSFYNLATKGYVLGGENKAILAEDVYNTNPQFNFEITEDETEGTTQAGFSVFIPENIQRVKEVVGSVCESYDDRESFNGKGQNKNWIFAPDKATYVVLKGICKEVDQSTGRLRRYGNVEYTIHLGDFSKNGSMTDFSVERNYIYTYTVSIQGMEKIKVEAEKTPNEDYQNGAEGSVIELGEASKVFSLDAHYEQVFVEYNLSNILREVQTTNPNADLTNEDDVNAVKEDIADHFQLSIHTPMNTVDTSDELRLPYSPSRSSGDESIDMAGIDYDWIEFYPQEENDAISCYPGEGSKKLHSPYQICRMMGEAIYQMFEHSDNSSFTPSVAGLIIEQEGEDCVARFTIFVNEYFYKTKLDGTTVAWGDFTGKEPRTMLIASNMEISDDLNSTYSTAQTYITQRAIETFYRPESDYNTNALGLETYNENGVIQGFGDANNRTDDWSNGRTNMLVNVGILRNSNSTDWQTVKWYDYSRNSGYIDFTQVGYIDDNSLANHQWKYELNSNSAYYACLSRNRDLNGDGNIDKDEVRWYLPALSQYLRMGIGTKALSNETQLYTGIKSQMQASGYPASYLKDGALYFVNTSDPRDGGDFTLYWAVEVGSYGSPGMGGGGAMIRCVRNLPKESVVQNARDDETLVNDKALADPVYGTLKAINDGNAKNAVFDFGDRLVESIFRNSDQAQYGPYRPHTEEDDDEMMLPGAFVVAAADTPVLNAQIAFGIYTNDNYDHGYDPCSTYSEANDGSDRGYWRTPNLNELMVMSTVNDQIQMKTNSFSRTQFSNTRVRPGFYFNTSGMITVNGSGNDHTGNISGSGYVRCVRDATADDLSAAGNW